MAIRPTGERATHCAIRAPKNTFGNTKLQQLVAPEAKGKHILS